MSAAVSAILEGMPEPRDLRMHQHDGRCVITAGPVVLFEYAAGDIVMRNIALAALRQLGFRGRVVAAVLGLTENYVATLHNAAKRDGSAVLIRQDRRGGPGKVTAAQWEQARVWREQGASDAEIGRRLGVANTTVGRGLGPRGQAPAPPDQAGRRAWQLAAAAAGPDEEIAVALEGAAAGFRQRGGDTGALAWYQRAAELSADPVAKARRLTLAAETAAGSGDLDQAAALAAEGLVLTMAVPAPERAWTWSARALQVQATVAFLRGDPAAAHRRLLEASELIAPADQEQANALLIEAVHSGWYVGQDELAEGVTRLEGLRLRPTALEQLLLRAVAPILGRPVDGSDPDSALAEARSAAAGNAPGLVLVCGLALLLGQDRAAQQIGDELSRELRAAGQIGWLPSVLFYAGSAQAYGGRHEEAVRTVAEGLRLARDTGQQRWVDALAEPLALLAAARGDEQLCRQLADEALSRTSRPAWSVPWTASTLGLLDLGLGRAESALARLETLAEGRRFFHIPATRSTPDLVEAAVRLGRPEAAAEPLALFETWSRNTGQSWTTALVRRCRALLDGDEDLFLAALALHEGDSRPFDEARTRLLYGEWLRREKRKADARAQLRIALETLERIGAAPWAERARAELTATGITGRADDHGPSGSLTPQELQIVRLAAQGLSNKDIAAQLFLSARTVGHHLYKAYPKLGVASRGELADLVLG